MTDFSKTALFAGMAERMRYLSARQEVIAGNVANANTPKYHAKDLKPVDFSDVIEQQNHNLHMTVTQPGHMSPPPLGGDFQMTEKKKGFEQTINGNNVVLDEEMKKLAETNADYQTTTGLYSKTTNLVKIALGSGS